MMEIFYPSGFWKLHMLPDIRWFMFCWMVGSVRADPWLLCMFTWQIEDMKALWGTVPKALISFRRHPQDLIIPKAPCLLTQAY